MKTFAVLGVAAFIATFSSVSPAFAHDDLGVVPVVKNPVSMLLLSTSTNGRDGKPTVIRFVPERTSESSYRGVGLEGTFRMVMVEKHTERGPMGSVQKFVLRVQDAFGRNTAMATYYPLGSDQVGCAYTVSVGQERFCSRSGVLELDGVTFTFWDR